ncbi:MAG TPA: hypothetical protein DCE44_25965 [Verrucomicrobiales bacterium]|nr:hypothetical protein [Verrucomicrobiales bacterium]
MRGWSGQHLSKGNAAFLKSSFTRQTLPSFPVVSLMDVAELKWAAVERSPTRLCLSIPEHQTLGGRREPDSLRRHD